MTPVWHTRPVEAKPPRRLWESRITAGGGCATLLLVLLAFAKTAIADVAQARRGMVVTVHPIATDVGVKVMRDGGNAFDAAVAAAFMLGVIDGHNSGIGGGCFIMYRLPDGRMGCLDAREVAPAGATRDMFVRDGKPTTRLSQIGALAGGVPGALAGYEQIVRRFGRKPLRELILPAAEVAEKGFAINARYAARVKEQRQHIAQFPETAQMLLGADNTAPEAGDVLVQKDLATSYRAIADKGTGWFYKGPFADAVDAWMRKNGGVLTSADLGQYRTRQREPVVTDYRGFTIVGFPPPSSGGIHVGQILNILEQFDVRALHQRNKADRIHVIAEAMKIAFADRAHWLGDPDFVRIPRRLVDQSYADRLAEQIQMDRAAAVTHGEPGTGEGPFVEQHTTHIAAADATGNWVGITTSLNTAFGSKVMIPRTGVILNNHMDDFAIGAGTPNAFGLVGSDANAVAPGKRPLSSMSPTIVLEEGKPVMTLGAAGGPRIISQVVLVISNVIDLGDSPADALARARFHHQWMPDRLWIEATVPEPVREELKRRGHVLDVRPPRGAAQAIFIDADGTLIGVAEPRLDGKAAGP